MHAQLKDICAILSGLMVAQDYKRGQQLLVDRNFSDNATFFQVGAKAQLLLMRAPQSAMLSDAAGRSIQGGAIGSRHDCRAQC